jgi:hypothetical protein
VTERFGAQKRVLNLEGKREIWKLRREFCSWKVKERFGS